MTIIDDNLPVLYREMTPTPKPSTSDLAAPPLADQISKGAGHNGSVMPEVNGYAPSENGNAATFAFASVPSNLGLYDPILSLSPPNSTSFGIPVHVQKSHTHLPGRTSFMSRDGRLPDKIDTPLSSSAVSDSSRTSGISRRSNQQHQASSSRRPGAVNQPHLPTPPAHFYAPSSPTSTHDGVHVPSSLAAVPLPSPKPPLQPYPSASSYTPPNTYPGQYAMSSQPPMNMVPGSQSYPYTHAHGYHPGVHGSMESSMLQQNTHSGYQSMMQHLPHPPYSYPPHSPDATHTPYATSPSLYPLAHVNNLSSSSHTPLPSQPGGSPHPGTYNGQFQNLRYPSPPSPFSYGPQPMPPPYQWWYVQGSPVPNSYNDGVPMQYQPHYPKPLNYAQHVNHPEVESHPRYPRSNQPNMTSSPASSTSGATTQPGRRPGPQPQQGPPAAPSISSAPVSNSPIIPVRPARSPPDAIGTRPFKPIVRRDYHPNPPAQRSEWVMWAGNVPGDTTHDELWRFLKQPSTPRSDASSDTESSSSDGVTSIFLISRSNCAFVNFDTADHLRRAILRFNGQQVRPHDPKCPRLVCRARKKEDDLRAGVGGQRGMGVHKRWIKDHRQPDSEGETPPSSMSDDRRSSLSSSSDRASRSVGPPPLSSSDDEVVRSPHYVVKAPSGSSHASTNSSFLSRYFPRRFFILKSLTQFDLDLSVDRGLWATQKHNEAILDQAFRTSKDVFLIFSVNKSGEFYGYAKMTGRILHGERRVSWASRADSSPSSLSSLSSAHGRQQEQAIPEDPDSPLPSQSSRVTSFFTPSEHRLVDESPAPFTPSMMGGSKAIPGSSKGPSHHQSAPAALGPLPAPEFSSIPPTANFSLSERKIRPVASTSLKSAISKPSDDIELDKNAPFRAIRNKAGSTDDSKLGTIPLQPVAEEDNTSGNDEDHTHEKTSEPGKQEAGTEGRDGTWGETFKVEWISTQRLPFYQTKHLRNAWNHEREIKVSRDGTELEPGVGQQLLEEWKALAEAASRGQDSRPDNVRKRAVKSAPLLTGADGGPRSIMT